MSTEFTTDKEFVDAYMATVDRSSWIPGKTYTVLSSADCAVCTRPLYGKAHEEWHVNRHVEQLGLTKD